MIIAAIVVYVVSLLVCAYASVHYIREMKATKLRQNWFGGYDRLTRGCLVVEIIHAVVMTLFPVANTIFGLIFIFTYLGQVYLESKFARRLSRWWNEQL